MKISKLLIMLTFLTALSTISTTKSKSKSKWKINLLPNKEYEIENPFPFTFEEKCKFKYENPSDKISLKLIKGKAFSNFEELSKNQTNFNDNENKKNGKEFSA